MAIDVFQWVWSDGVLCSFHLASTLQIISLMYVSPQIQTPL